MRDPEIDNLRRELNALRAYLQTLRPHIFDREEATGGGDGIIDIRFNTTTKWIEVAFASDPQTWVQKIQVADPCEGT